MMLYILTSHFAYEDAAAIMGAFSSKEKALDYLEKHKRAGLRADYVELVYEVLDAPYTEAQETEQVWHRPKK